MHYGHCKYLDCLFGVWLLAGNDAESHGCGAVQELSLASAQQFKGFWKSGLQTLPKFYFWNFSAW